MDKTLKDLPKMAAKDRPVQKFWDKGVALNIWMNESSKGGKWYSVTIDRNYQAADNSYKTSKTFNAKDLPIVVDHVHKAIEWMAANPL